MRLKNILTKLTKHIIVKVSINAQRWLDSGHGEGFCIGNILKYAQRYGKKNGKNRADLLKVIHYGIIALHLNNGESEWS